MLITCLFIKYILNLLTCFRAIVYINSMKLYEDDSQLLGLESLLAAMQPQHDNKISFPVLSLQFNFIYIRQFTTAAASRCFILLSKEPAVT